jgi:16S rRNA (adenine1518-N6/adenine1519-N6)-dimethyltransferase
MRTKRQPLGQHWLKDKHALQAVLNAGEVSPDDTVLEIGPGQGDLTALLVEHANKVIAVEIDSTLHQRLTSRFQDVQHLDLINQDIRTFDLTSLPVNYKVVANIPYYLTGQLLRLLLGSPNPPKLIALLVQREVAERLAAQPGDLSVLGVMAQFYSDVVLRDVVLAKAFTPLPAVDSQIVQLQVLSKPRFSVDEKRFFQLVKAGFSERRKKLRSSIAGGMRMTKEAVDKLLKQSGVSPDARAQELSLGEWYKLYKGLYG